MDLTTVEQLIIYFAGHGVNLSLSEYWLLSGSPEDSNAAVNVAGSMQLARYGGIPNVVFISDACRTAVEGIQAQAIRGSEIFPNVPDAASQRCVDVFYACALGAPALEVKDPRESASQYRAVFTEALIEALYGLKDVVVEDPGDGTQLRLIEEKPGQEGRRLVRSWPLTYHLKAEVAHRLEEANVRPGVTQIPDATLNSRNSWLSEIPWPAIRPRSRAPAGRRRATAKPASGEAALSAPPAAGGVADAPPPEEAASSPTASKPVVRVPKTLREASSSLLRSTLGEKRVLACDPVGGAGAEEGELQDALSRIFQPFGPRDFPASCGFKVRGTRFVSALSTTASVEVDDAGELMTVEGLDAPAANVLIEFDNGSGLVLPVISEHVGSITVEDGDVVNVTYEPARTSALWEGVKDRVDELRSLRALLASSARMGALRLRERDVAELAERMKVRNGFDPTMALYAGYAFTDRQEEDPVRRLSEALRNDLSLELFDVEMLAGRLRGRHAGWVAGPFPFGPLLARGWAVMGALGAALPPALQFLGEHRVESPWTLFNPKGVEMIRSAIEDKEID